MFLNSRRLSAGRRSSSRRRFGGVFLHRFVGFLGRERIGSIGKGYRYDGSLLRGSPWKGVLQDGHNALAFDVRPHQPDVEACVEDGAVGLLGRKPENVGHLGRIAGCAPSV